jgi:pimeloyl-ACP methyl ester carboxylesterase
VATASQLSTSLLPVCRQYSKIPRKCIKLTRNSNYGFSGPALKRGFNVARTAEACHKVMLALGYDQYVTQGGDWGFVITRALASLYPQHVKAHHINWAWAAQPESFPNGEPEYSEREKKQLTSAERWNPFGTGDGRGYIAIQSTRPATINFAFRDSPVALLAWIYDKLVDWSDEYPWTDDEVCLWVSVYVLSRAGPDAASYLYYEALHDPTDMPVPVVQGYIDVPLGIADFPVELANSPQAWRSAMGPIVFQKLYEKGGHFAGWERPGDIADGLCEMFGKKGGAYGVVTGKDGY